MYLFMFSLMDLFVFHKVFQENSISTKLMKIDVNEDVGNEAKRRISKRVFQENKVRQIFRKTNISYPDQCPWNKKIL